MADGALELSKFQRKADAYRRALNIAPYSRSLEIVPLLAYLKGLCEALGVLPHRLRIVDFMSGDGHLSRILHGQGYRNIVAIESCNEMSFASQIYEKVKLVNAPDAVSGLRVIEQVNPHVVVSLAAFHHLIEVNDDGEIDRAKSVELQRAVVSQAFSAAPDLLLFMIVDLADASRGHWGFDRWGLWRGMSRRKARMLDRVDFGKLSNLYLASSFGDFCDAVDRAFLTKPQAAFALPWFREVVDRNTEIGHKDIAISDEFLDELSSAFTVNYRKFACPWHFDSDEQLGEFLQEKFGFSVGDEVKSPADVKAIARSRHLILARDGLDSFLWDLGIVIIERPGLAFKKRSIVDRLYLFPLGLLAFALLYGLGRLYGVNADVLSWCLNGAFLMAGGSVKMLLGDEGVTHR